MNYRTILLNITLGTLLLSCSSCQQGSDQGTQISGRSVQSENAVRPDSGAEVTDQNGENNSPVSVTENFEQAQTAKPSYAAAAVTLSSGKWILDDALLGGSKDDVKNGDHAVRLRNSGKLSMQFDVNGVRDISLKHAVYGHDATSSWQLWASKDEGKNYEQVGETITTEGHELTVASFPIQAGGKVRFEIRKISGGKNRLNIDDLIFNTADHGTTNEDHNANAAGTEPQQGREHKTAIRSQSADDDHLLLGNPSNAAGNADNYLIDQKYYVESYNRTKAGPNWVSWHIGSADLGSTDRLNNFRPDTSLPAGWYEADNTSYRGSGFDKGHNCPSGDRTSSTAANSATFLMDNIIPQAPNNNQHTWEHLESYCRDQVKKGNEVYVIMGSYGSGGTGKNGYFKSIDNGRINVPSHIWKVVVILPDGNNDLQRINMGTRVIAIDTPNDNTITPNWMNYLCTVRDIEKATGYNLLSALPEPVQNVIETIKFKGGN
ncbi:MAG TPA: DNA/RNA non-specific endonuclease [Pedobacter sp.]